MTATRRDGTVLARCDFCGDTWRRTPGPGRPARTCSDACRQADYRARRDSRLRLEAAVEAKLWHTCASCNGSGRLRVDEVPLPFD